MLPSIMLQKNVGNSTPNPLSPAMIAVRSLQTAPPPYHITQAQPLKSGNAFSYFSISDKTVSFTPQKKIRETL
jgi:hypothetical protein